MVSFFTIIFYFLIVIFKKKLKNIFSTETNGNIKQQINGKKWQKWQFELLL